MTTWLPRFVVVMVLAAGLAACGFKLRSNDYRLPASWQTLSIETRDNLSENSELTRELSLQLRREHGVTVEHGVQPSLPRVVLLSEQFHNPVSSLDRLGRAQEYLLEYIVYYQLVDGAGKELFPKQRIYLRQEQSYSSSSILAKEQEQAYLQRQLRRRMAARIVERLLATLNRG